MPFLHCLVLSLCLKRSQQVRFLSSRNFKWLVTDLKFWNSLRRVNQTLVGAASGLLWPMCFLFKGPPLQEAGFEWSALLTLRPDVDSGLRRVGKVRGCPSPEVFTDFFGKHSRQVITWASSFLSQELKVVLMCCSVWTVTLQPVFLYCEAAVNICPRGSTC